jgi:acetyl-CoA acetyltransferase
MAGMSMGDIDLMEVHDASAPAELMLYEDLGLCGLGEGGRLVDEGATEIGGRIPVNTSGGLLAKGHPVGATGIAQAFEIWLQLQGLAGERQVEGAKTALTHNGGGMVRGEAAATVVHVYST